MGVTARGADYFNFADRRGVSVAVGLEARSAFNIVLWMKV